MPMHLVRVRLSTVSCLSAVTGWLALPNTAQAIAHTPTFSGNAWVAFGIIGALVVTIFLLIMGALGIERRDATIGRRGRNEGWFGLFPPSPPDDEDGPHFHLNGGGGNAPN